MITYSIGIILALAALYMTAGTGNAICLKSGKFNPDRFTVCSEVHP